MSMNLWSESVFKAFRMRFQHFNLRLEYFRLKRISLLKPLVASRRSAWLTILAASQPVQRLLNSSEQATAQKPTPTTTAGSSIKVRGNSLQCFAHPFLSHIPRTFHARLVSNVVGAQWWAIRAGITTYQHSSRIRERSLDGKALDADRGIRLWNSLSTALRRLKSSPARLTAMMTSPWISLLLGSISTFWQA